MEGPRGVTIVRPWTPGENPHRSRAEPGRAELEGHQFHTVHAAFMWGSRHRNGYRLECILRMPDAFLSGCVEFEPATVKDGKMPIRQYLDGEKFDPETT